MEPIVAPTREEENAIVSWEITRDNERENESRLHWKRPAKKLT